MKTLRNLGLFSCLLGSLALSTGCTTKLGSIRPQTTFAFPNSNITPLGPVKVEKSKTTFFVSPRWTIEDAKDAYNDALAQAHGANIIIDYKEDTAVTRIMGFTTLTYTIEGTAARMDVGKKPLQ
jgi:hypothetical protein